MGLQIAMSGKWVVRFGGRDLYYLPLKPTDEDPLYTIPSLSRFFCIFNARNYYNLAHLLLHHFHCGSAFVIHPFVANS